MFVMTGARHSSFVVLHASLPSPMTPRNRLGPKASRFGQAPLVGQATNSWQELLQLLVDGGCAARRSLVSVCASKRWFTCCKRAGCESKNRPRPPALLAFLDLLSRMFRPAVFALDVEAICPHGLQFAVRLPELSGIHSIWKCFGRTSIHDGAVNPSYGWVGDSIYVFARRVFFLRAKAEGCGDTGRNPV